MDRLKLVEAGIARLSAWIDAGKPEDVSAETQVWHRISKIGEEFGETIEALIGAFAMNPRKGQSHTWDDVDKELLDCLVSAWAALEHRHGNAGVVADMLHSFVGGLLTRAGLAPTGGSMVDEGAKVRVLAWDERDARHVVAPETPYVGEVFCIGMGQFVGQPSVGPGASDDESDPQFRRTFAAAWELVE